MPLVSISIRKGRTKQQKAQLVKEITESMVRVLGTKAENVQIVIHEEPDENLAHGGQLLSDRTG
jgi:4-oxalocrotonate tautomerase